jgi:hypothetical protein
MHSTLRRRTTTAGLALALAVGAPAAGAAAGVEPSHEAMKQYLQDSGTAPLPGPTTGSDLGGAGANSLVSPDAADTAASLGAAAGQSLVSPDSRDAAANPGGPGAVQAPPVPVAEPSIRVVEVTDSGGLDWGDVAIGAAMALGLGLLGVAAATATMRYRHSHAAP